MAKITKGEFNYDKICKEHEKILKTMGKKEVKGGLVIEQLKRYAKRIADITDDAGSAEIVVWFHPNKTGGGGRYSVEFRAYCHAAKVNIRPKYETDDLRCSGEEIESFLMHREHDTI